MAGAIPRKTKSIKSTNSDDMNDPILVFLDQIRSVYCDYKKEKDDIIAALQKTNLHLTEQINYLYDKLNSTYAAPTINDKKRRKSNTSDDSDLDGKKLFGRVDIPNSGSDKSAEIDLNKFLNDQNMNVSVNKRLKTSSSDDSDLDNAKLINSMKIYDSSTDKSIDSALNEAINDGNILLDDSEILFPPTQKTPTKRTNTSSVKNILSPSNKNNVVQKLYKSPPMKKIQLPKRMISNRNNENQHPIKKIDSWISKNQINKKTENIWNMSFIQPVEINSNNLNLSGEVIASSQVQSKRAKNLKHSQKLRQSKLEFDIERKPETRTVNEEDKDTFCEDVVGASPTCTKSVTDSRTLRKNPRKNSDDDLFVFSMKKPLSNETIATSNPKQITSISRNKAKLTPTKNSIKLEPKSEQKDVLLKSRFFDHMLTDDTIDGLETIISNDDKKEDTAKKMLDDDSSLFVLPSQPDDVIIVEDTDLYDYNLSSMDLLAELMRDDKDTQPLLQRFEDVQIKSLQSKDNNNKKSSTSPPTSTSRLQFPQSKDNNKKISSTSPSTSTSRLQFPQNKSLQRKDSNIKKSSTSPPTSTSRLQLSQNKNKSKDDETQLANTTKLSEIFDDKNDFTTTSIKVPEKKGFHDNCDECQRYKKYLISQNVPPDEIERRLRTCKRPPKLHLTPDGFWDPCYREWPANDPRNEVLFDYRFTKNNSDKNNK